MSPSTPIVRAETIADKVYALLRREIASGIYRPGQRIHEKQLAEGLGISRTPIREALLRLETEQVVVCNSRRSYNVRRLTSDDVRGIYETLGILEGAAAVAAVPRLTPADFSELERLNTSMQEAAAAADLHGFGDLNRGFHDIFLERVDNSTLRVTCDLVRGRLYMFPVREDSLADWLGKSVDEHRTIIRLAREGEADALGVFFRNVHWSYERNRGFIDDAFDAEA